MHSELNTDYCFDPNEILNKEYIRKWYEMIKKIPFDDLFFRECDVIFTTETPSPPEEQNTEEWLALLEES